MNYKSTTYHCPSYSTRYTFSGKERDEETGFSYFAARHYDSGLSLWLSVDPMSDKYPSMSPYTYCGNNPVRLVDEDGEEINPVFDWYGIFLGYDDAGKGGIPIIMEGSHFSPGMSHQQAMDNMKHDINRGLGLTEEGINKIKKFYQEQGVADSESSLWDDFVDMLNRADIACRGHADNSRWEGHGDCWERQFEERAEPYVTSAVLLFPNVSFVNSVKTVTTGSDIYENKADGGDYTLGIIGTLLGTSNFFRNVPKFVKRLDGINTLFSFGYYEFKSHKDENKNGN